MDALAIIVVVAVLGALITLVLARFGYFPSLHGRGL